MVKVLQQKLLLKLKFANDTTVVGLITDNDETA